MHLDDYNDSYAHKKRHQSGDLGLNKFASGGQTHQQCVRHVVKNIACFPDELGNQGMGIMGNKLVFVVLRVTRTFLLGSNKTSMISFFGT